jgi:hypothetical protein
MRFDANEAEPVLVREAVKGTGIPTRASMKRLLGAIKAGHSQVSPTFLRGAWYFYMIDRLKMAKKDAEEVIEQLGDFFNAIHLDARFE